MVKNKKNNLKENEALVAGLSYLLIGVIWFLVDKEIKKSKLAKFHVKQSINFFIFLFSGGIILNLVSIILTFTIILMPIAMLLIMVFWLITLVLFVIGLVNGFGGKKKELPIIGEFAEKYLKF